MTTISAPAGVRQRASVYARLSNLYFYDYYLSVLVAWSLIGTATRFDGRTLLTMVLVDLGWVCVVAATVTFDDVSGFRDGSDDRNYAPQQGEQRSRSNKPLLAGELTLGQAVGFGRLTTAGGVVFWGLAYAVAPHRPVWAIPVAAFVLLISVQYSYGLKLSYHRAQELVLLLSPGLMVLLPFGLLQGHVSGLILLESYLFGLWSLLVSVYSNLNDVDGDRLSGRRNLATTLPPHSYRRVVAAITATEVLALAVAFAWGAASWWLLLFLAPVLLVHARQVRVGLIGQNHLAARRLGITAHRVGAVVLIIANLALVSQ
ncbi:MAG: UbiA family prenyltransferase [Streptosporangiaceae bacterium]